MDHTLRESSPFDGHKRRKATGVGYSTVNWTLEQWDEVFGLMTLGQIQEHTDGYGLYGRRGLRSYFIQIALKVESNAKLDGCFGGE